MKLEVRRDEARSPFRSSIVESGEGHEVRSKKSEGRSVEVRSKRSEVRSRMLAVGSKKLEVGSSK